MNLLLNYSIHYYYYQNYLFILISIKVIPYNKFHLIYFIYLNYSLLNLIQIKSNINYFIFKLLKVYSQYYIIILLLIFLIQIINFNLITFHFINIISSKCKNHYYGPP